MLEAVIEIGEESIDLELLGDGAPIAFTRRLSHVAIDLSEHPVRLGVPGLLFEVGSGVSVRAPEIEISADSLLVRDDGRRRRRQHGDGRRLGHRDPARACRA